MCFNPAISLTTAIIEFILVGVLLSGFRRTPVRDNMCVLITFLGLYQLSEFMLCQSGNPFLWAELGFLIYTFLPAMGLDTTLMIIHKRRFRSLVYALPVIFAILAIVSQNFVSDAYCATYAVQVVHLFNSGQSIWTDILHWIYSAYYAGFIVAMMLIYLVNIIYEKNSTKQMLYFSLLVGGILMTLPTFVVMIVAPMYQYMFPSVLCHFGLLFGIMAFIAVTLESRIAKK